MRQQRWEGFRELELRRDFELQFVGSVELLKGFKQGCYIIGYKELILLGEVK